MEPIVDLKADRYYFGIWYIELPRSMSKYEKGGNYMATAYRENGIWTVTTRIRWYRDPDPDEFCVYRNELPDPMGEPVLADKLNRIVKTVALGAGVEKVEFLSIRGGANEFMAEAKRMNPSWLHIGQIEKLD